MIPSTTFNKTRTPLATFVTILFFVASLLLIYTYIQKFSEQIRPAIFLSLFVADVFVVIVGTICFRDKDQTLILGIRIGTLTACFAVAGVFILQQMGVQFSTAHTGSIAEQANAELKQEFHMLIESDQQADISVTILDKAVLEFMKVIPSEMQQSGFIRKDQLNVLRDIVVLYQQFKLQNRVDWLQRYINRLSLAAFEAAYDEDLVLSDHERKWQELVQVLNNGRVSTAYDLAHRDAFLTAKLGQYEASRYNFVEAQDLLDEAEEDAVLIYDEALKQDVLIEILKGYVVLQQTDVLLKKIDEFSAWFSESVNNKLIASLVNTKQIKQAFQMIDESAPSFYSALIILAKGCVMFPDECRDQSFTLK